MFKTVNHTPEGVAHVATAGWRYPPACASRQCATPGPGAPHCWLCRQCAYIGHQNTGKSRF